MHSGEQASEDDVSSESCVMRGTCSGPIAALVTVLSNTGILPDPLALDVDLHSTLSIHRRHEQPQARLQAPESPPPRA